MIYIYINNIKIEFLTINDRNKIKRLLYNSNYYYRFNKIDFIVRKCKNIDDCINLYCDNIETFTKYEKQYLTNLCKKINKKIKQFSKLKLIKWKFCKLNSKIENGYPHTHNDIIFISQNFFEYNMEDNLITLLHELIHIYQRFNKNKTINFHNKIGLFKSKCLCDKLINHRTSPDDFNNDHYIFKGYLVKSNYFYNANNLSNMDIIFEKVNSNLDLNGDKILKNLKIEYGIQIESANEVSASIISQYIIKNIKFDKYLNNFDLEVYKYLN